MELRYIKWGKFFKSCLSKKCLKRIPHMWSLQWFLSGVIREQEMLIINLDQLNKDLYLEYAGIKFIPDLIGYSTIFFSWKDYPIELIKLQDKVLDLGACVGGFALPASKRAKIVYAVEPIRSLVQLLKKNIQLNGISNIKVLPYALGKINGTEIISYEGLSSICQVLNCKSLLNLVGKVDVVKMDCEGAEWFLDWDILKNVRLLFGELHYNKYPKGWDFLKEWLNRNKYQYIHRYSGRKKLGYFIAEKEV